MIRGQSSRLDWRLAIEDQRMLIGLGLRRSASAWNAWRRPGDVEVDPVAATLLALGPVDDGGEVQAGAGFFRRLDRQFGLKPVQASNVRAAFFHLVCPSLFQHPGQALFEPGPMLAAESAQS